MKITLMKAKLNFHSISMSNTLHLYNSEHTRTINYRVILILVCLGINKKKKREIKKKKNFHQQISEEPKHLESQQNKNNRFQTKTKKK